MTRSLADDAVEAFPAFADVVRCKTPPVVDVWSGDLSSGKPLEILTLFALARVAAATGFAVHLDRRLRGPDGLFYLRNEIPRPHGATPGKQVGTAGGVPMALAFEAALVPRLVLSDETRSFEVFREGSPLHLLRSAATGVSAFRSRPDLIAIEGRTTVVREGREVVVSHDGPFGRLDAVIAIRESAILPIVRYAESSSMRIAGCGLVECSMGKKPIRLSEQLDLYEHDYGIDHNAALFVHAGPADPVVRTLTVERHALVASLVRPISATTIEAALTGWRSPGDV